MKLTQEACPNCYHIKERESKTCPTCGAVKKQTPAQMWSVGFATIGRTYPSGTVQ
jgi:RNA polymerase subunit RPABC4/transcription elongation factor Spt4